MWQNVWNKTIIIIFDALTLSKLNIIILPYLCDSRKPLKWIEHLSEY